MGFADPAFCANSRPIRDGGWGNALLTWAAAVAVCERVLPGLDKSQVRIEIRCPSADHLHLNVHRVWNFCRSALSLRHRSSYVDAPKRDAELREARKQSRAGSRRIIIGFFPDRLQLWGWRVPAAWLR